MWDENQTRQQATTTTSQDFGWLRSDNANMLSRWRKGQSFHMFDAFNYTYGPARKQTNQLHDAKMKKNRSKNQLKWYALSKWLSYLVTRRLIEALHSARIFLHTWGDNLLLLLLSTTLWPNWSRTQNLNHICHRILLVFAATFRKIALIALRVLDSKLWFE